MLINVYIGMGYNTHYEWNTQSEINNKKKYAHSHSSRIYYIPYHYLVKRESKLYQF